MLFQNAIEPRCGYCKRGRPLGDGQVICPKRGVVAPGYSCKHFDYDPLKRVPPRPVSPVLPVGEAEDFEL